jgi:protein-tyrosine phosphatase
MPFSAYDPGGEILDGYLEKGISLIIVLASDEECLRRTGRDLRRLYVSSGLEVVYLPIEDYGTPDRSNLDAALGRVDDHAASGGAAAILCYAGVGRTGLFTACLARRLMGVSGEEAIRWVRQYIPGAVEIKEQEQFVLDYSST